MSDKTFLFTLFASLPQHFISVFNLSEGHVFLVV